jgi:EAL domain-containing protein (putative c-di-GMP-specific phosphodiesterase class I)/PleD family two-component response regulator
MAIHEARGRLLVVDDEEMLARVMARRLIARGFDVQVSLSGADALARIQAEPFDLVLLDVMMPEMSGLEVLTRIRETRSPAVLPVVMLTSRSDTETVVGALHSGANDYVNKPAQMAILLARVQAQLARKLSDEALRKSEERYALAARGSRDVLWDWDKTTDEVYMSQGAGSLLGDHAVGPYTGPSAPLQSLVHPDDQSRIGLALRALYSEPEAGIDVEVRVRGRSPDEWVWVLVRGCAVRDPSGWVLRVAGSLSDLSTPRLHDRVTGLPNRLLLLEQLRTRIEHEATAPGVMIVALDRADQVSVMLGQAAADELTTAAAQRIRDALATLVLGSRPVIVAGSLCQVGPQEFGVILHPMAQPGSILRAATTLRAAVGETFALTAAQVRSSVSIGIAQGPDGVRPDELLEHGLSAVTRARTLPGGVAVFSEDAHTAALERISLESDLSAAIANGELHLEYQPIVDLTSAEPVAFEALCRWEHPTRGRIPPDVFVPLAESTGLAGALGRWVLRRACSDAQPWHRADGTAVRICVNVSPLQFLETDRLEIELTEGVFAQQPERIQAVMTRIRTLGVRVALDDFGTGYSSLAYLVRFPLDTLKLDRSFVAKLPGGERSEAITRATLAMAHELGLEVVAEGIEEERQAGYLREFHCELGQGWHFGRPSRAAHWDALLSAPLAIAR